MATTIPTMSPAARARQTYLRATCSAACGADWLRLAAARDAVQTLRAEGATAEAIARAESVLQGRREDLRAELRRWAAIDADEATAFARWAGIRIV